MTKVRIQLLKNGQLPVYATPGSAGADLHAAIEEPITLEPSDRIIVPCGFIIAIPEGFEAQLRSRSGLSSKNGVIVLNSPGTIDSDYRGEVKTILANMGKHKFEVTPGMRIAQMIIAPVSKAEWNVCDLSEDATQRQEGGFGSTGK
jgi:dUTP pyrophosphatase